MNGKTRTKYHMCAAPPYVAPVTAPELLASFATVDLDFIREASLKGSTLLLAQQWAHRQEL